VDALCILLGADVLHPSSLKIRRPAATLNKRITKPPLKKTAIKIRRHFQVIKY